MSPLICLRPQQDRIGLISEKLDKITTSAKRVMELENLGPTTATTSSPLQPRNLYYPPDDSDFVALNDKVDEVIKLLCDGEMPNTIAVTGAPVSGKTFLTKVVYNATEVKRHFDGRAWVNFSGDFESREFLIDILTQLTWDWEFLDENLCYEELKLKLLNFSSNKRCLIVVDDFPTLEYFNRLFDVCGLSSKGIWLILIVCMQDEEFASLEVKPCFCHLIRLRSLTKKESWTLICKMAPTVNRLLIRESLTLTTCGGSPRTILTMEGLLSTTKRPRVIERGIRENILNLCYDDLSSRMKVCFLYFRLFPRAFEIPVRRLFHLWVAEGLFITLPDEENMAPEDLAEECLKLLVRRNLIEVTKVRLDGSPKTCRMPTTIWDVFSPKAEVLGHSHDHNKIYRYGNHDLSDIRRLTNYAANGIDPQFYRHIQRLRSYVSFNSESSRKFLDALVTPGGFGLLTYIGSEIILQTLSGLFIGNKNVVKSYLYSLHHLRKLKLTFYSKSVEGIASWLSELNTLRSLKLRSIDEFDRPATLELGYLVTLRELSELYLVGPFTISIRSLCARNLKVLTLSASKLEKDPMPVLGRLPYLNCLRLFRNSHLGKDMTCPEEGFPQLRVLKLWMLENLEEWTLMEGTMPLLRELEIRLCPRLKQPRKLPLTLKDVVLINMPDGFVECAERVLVNSFVRKITWPFAA
ncbi:disease resistance protein rpp13 [Quercus suber]|uniref:Disease resistance protein rpp13 n=1 Tax=Quercus suber TaxID=58331 RepID=A0AAW0KJV6_QUESU